MSKMSWLHVELTEKANELGFESIEEAEQNGYEISMDGMTPTLKPNTKKQLELAHEAWLKEREEVVKSLDHLMLGYVEMGHKEQADVLQHAIEFIEKGEC